MGGTCSPNFFKEDKTCACRKYQKHLRIAGLPSSQVEDSFEHKFHLYLCLPIKKICNGEKIIDVVAHYIIKTCMAEKNSQNRHTCRVTL